MDNLAFEIYDLDVHILFFIFIFIFCIVPFYSQRQKKLKHFNKVFAQAFLDLVDLAALAGEALAGAAPLTDFLADGFFL